MGGPAAAGRFPLLALVLAVFMVGYVMWQADRLPALARASTAPPRDSRPRVHAGARGTTGGDGRPARRSARRVWRAGQHAPRPAPPVLSPRLAACCQIAMAVTMGYMLILLL